MNDCVWWHRACVFGMAIGAWVVREQPLVAAERSIRFDRDIRPILSENCYACHGPGAQEAGLRLDLAEAAMAHLDSGGRAIVAGDPKASELVGRIDATDPDMVMPPPHTNKTLSPEQRELLRRWITAGAAYERHWSFRPIVRPEVPGGSDPAVTNPIDRFLEARLAETNLPLNPEKDFDGFGFEKVWNPIADEL